VIPSDHNRVSSGGPQGHGRICQFPGVAGKTASHVLPAGRRTGSGPKPPEANRLVGVYHAATREFSPCPTGPPRACQQTAGVAGGGKPTSRRSPVAIKAGMLALSRRMVPSATFHMLALHPSHPGSRPRLTRSRGPAAQTRGRSCRTPSADHPHVERRACSRWSWDMEVFGL